MRATRSGSSSACRPSRHFGAIIGALVAPGLEARHREDDARASVQAILDTRAFTPFFQPIVEFHTGAVVGYEALSRFGNGIPPDAVFALAVRAGLGIELETATLVAALEAATILPPGAYLSVNASPALIGSSALPLVLGGLRRAIVLEVTEHVVIDDYPALRHALAGLGPTVRLAVDDAGAGYASLRHILELAPDFVKLDIGLTRGIDADPARQALIAGIGYFALKRKLRLIAEGIETVAELQALRQLGIDYGQGYLLGSPQSGRGPGPWPTKISLSAS
jgi:EAL domain-containing protein (putative c-di-GMP-specific phosphodiesterase class I)